MYKINNNKGNKKKANYVKIAQEAGVSIATVSRILNNYPHVKHETRKKVIDSMNMLGYDTNEIIIKPEPKNSSLIIFNIPSLNNPFYSQIVNGAEAAATRHGYHILINESDINLRNFNYLLDILKKFNVAGLIISNYLSSELLDKLNSTVPLVQCCEYNEDSDIPYVSIDDTLASKRVMEYILSNNRRKIALINGPMYYKYARHRLNGYLDVLKSANIPIENNWIVNLPEIDYNMAVSACSHLLNLSNRPNAIFAISDVFAAAAIKASSNIGLRTPQDVLVVGFDDVDIATMTTPTITTVRQPKFQLGFRACELLIEKISDSNIASRKILLDVEFIIRESSIVPSSIEKI
ncbi:MAG: LacI family DNA-binding transcriptional regulator [Actinomycetota bacterium]